MDRNFNTVQIIVVVMQSLSARRAWIEMQGADFEHKMIRSLSARRAWIEISNADTTNTSLKSLSARRAWIEIILSR